MKSPAETSQRTSGLLYMVGAAFFFSLMSLFVKLVGQRLPSQQIVLVRSVITLIYSYIAVRWAGESLWGKRRGLLFLRGLLGFGGLSCFYLALTTLPLADATVIFYSNPVLTALFAALFLDERLGTREIAGALLSFAGIVLIARPSFLFGDAASGLSLLYVGIAFIGAVCAAGAYAVVRTLRGSEHPMVIVFYFPLVATVGSIPTAGFTNMQWPTLYEWILLIGGVGLTAQIAQVLLTNGLHKERAGRAMAMTYLQIVFAAIWGMLFFREFPDMLSIVGAIAVIGGTIVVARQ
jgi:drug/metabolite transporter (DMT)-like permease